MRKILLTLVLAAALPVLAQNKPPADLQPLPPPPPPPPGYELDPALEPQVTILKRGADTVEEYRIAGKLYMIKVTPPHGKPYYLVDERGTGDFTRHEGGLNEGLRPPMWVIHQW